MNISLSETKADIKSEDAGVNHASRLMAMGQMAASLAHEIRNPLGSIELYCGILKRELKDDAEKLDLVRHIQHGITNLSNIVSNCLLFTKDISLKKQKYSSAEKFLKETCGYVQNARAQVKEEMISQGSNLEIKWEETGENNFNMDPYVMGQIVINILLNSIDACLENNNENKHIVSIKIDHSEDETWCLEVNDTGIGMNEEVLSKLYDPFFTTKEKGTGLGLAIVHSLVNAHHGKIKISSKYGSGTSFKLIFRNN